VRSGFEYSFDGYGVSTREPQVTIVRKHQVWKRTMKRRKKVTDILLVRKLRTAGRKANIRGARGGVTDKQRLYSGNVISPGGNELLEIGYDRRVRHHLLPYPIFTSTFNVAT